MQDEECRSARQSKDENGYQQDEPQEPIEFSQALR
jgi:hypothetical protein